MNDRRKLLRVSVVLIAFGVASFLGMLGRPGFETIRAVDVVHLIGVGMCFGAAIFAFVLWLRTRS